MTYDHPPPPYRQLHDDRERMSIRAMNWAMSARTDGVSAQCVLFVVADTANEHGVSIHADPEYIAARTRQSRATVFRRLKELEAAGALTRLKRFRDDGAPLYEVRLNLDAAIDYEAPPDDGGSAQDIEGESQIETQARSQIETGKVSPVRPAESHSCDSQESPSKNPKEESPLPPKGGLGETPPGEESEQPSEARSQAGSDSWPSFEAAWLDPILRQSICRQVWAALTEAERALVTKAAQGYWAYRKSEKKPPHPTAPQTFLREPDAWPRYAKHAPDETKKPSPPVFVAEGSPDWNARRVLARICDFAEPNVTLGPLGRGAMFPSNLPIGGLVLARYAIDHEGKLDTRDWVIVETGSKYIAAWRERIHECTGQWIEPANVWTGETTTKQVGSKVYDNWKVMKHGLFVPSPWPPPKGTASAAAATKESRAG